jgi:hypothetical protein
VTRILLLLVYALWLMPPAGGLRPGMDLGLGLSIYFGGFVLVVVATALAANLVARHVGTESLGRSLARFNRMANLARCLIPAWQIVGIYGGPGWKHLVVYTIQPALPLAPNDLAWLLPAFLVGTLPPVLAWVGLWWATYPADRALREQSLLDLLSAVEHPPAVALHRRAHHAGAVGA